MSSETRAGFVALVGAPNAGKSTLTNRLVGTKVTIVSPKVQTTRSRVLGIVMVDQAQIILVDTPGIFQPKRRLERAMVHAAWSGAQDADMVCLLIDARKGLDDDSRAIIAKLAESKREAVLVLNKVDLLAQRERLLALSEEVHALGNFSNTFMISAEKGSGVADLMAFLAKSVAPGPWLFPEDQVSDMPQRLLAAEIVREKLFLYLNQELPYSIAVETESWEERTDGSARIDLSIYVLRESQKGIVLGKGGAQAKAIGQSARRELEELLERRIHLFLHVKVRENWLEERGHYSDLGLEFDA